jgi:outer membrane protein
MGFSPLCSAADADPITEPTFSETEAAAVGSPQYNWSLQEVLKIAENQSPDIQSAKANYQAASKVILQATSQYLPHVALEAGFEKTTLPNPSAGLQDNLGIPLPYSNMVARIRQTLFDFGKGINDIGAAQASSKSAERDMVAVHDLVELSALEGFFNVLLTTKLVAVAKQGVEQFQETYRRAGAFVRAGTRPSFDLTQASVELSRAKLRLVEAINSEDIARVTLLNLIGMQNIVRFQLQEPPPSERLDLKKLKIQDLTNKAIVNRPEVRRNEFALEAIRLQTHSVTKEYFPTVGLEGWYGKYFANYPSTLGDAYGGGLTITWAIFDGLKTTARLGELAARFEGEHANLEKQRTTVVADVAKSYDQLKRATDYLSLVEQNLTAAKENARLAKRRYDTNVASFLELLTAETGLLDAEAVSVQSKYQYEIALAALKHAVKAPLL